MLRPLLLFLLLFGVSVYGVVWVRRRLGALLKGRAAPTLDTGELRELSRQARSSKTLQQALELRAQLLEALQEREDHAGLRERVDRAIRQLFEQDKLRNRIQLALTSRTSEDRSMQETVDAFEERQVMLGRLETQAKLLEQEAERAVQELIKLHLSLLDLSASEAVMDEGSLGEALSELEAAGDAARQQVVARAEVERILASHSS